MNPSQSQHHVGHRVPGQLVTAAGAVVHVGAQAATNASESPHPTSTHEDRLIRPNEVVTEMVREGVMRIRFVCECGREVSLLCEADSARDSSRAAMESTVEDRSR